MKENGKPGLLVLEDGYSQEGLVYNLEGEVFGEVVFTTSMTGYQEVVTDPSYAGQIVTFTYPLVGNYGVCPAESEADTPKCHAIVVRQFTEGTREDRDTFGMYLKRSGIPVMEGVDTRALTRHIRTLGAMKGGIGVMTDERSLYEKVRCAPGLSEVDWVEKVTTQEVRTYGEGNIPVALIDYGVKASIIRNLVGAGCKVTIYPSSTPASVILKSGAKGVVLSNGPGDPAILEEEVGEVRKLIGEIPIFGICLGHQIIGLALGAKTYKMKFGHRGANHPVLDLKTKRVTITTQNHGFAIDAQSLEGTGLEVTQIAINDHTVEGIRHRDLPVYAVQYHPEGSPGPRDSLSLFDEFRRVISRP
ncbi:MAG: glutamine-hydrolyzing carbamoyl-phosphate synthase small subunit [bacterium JZ-2024 1]